MVYNIQDLRTVCESLAMAVAQDLMSREHAKAIWFKFLKESGIDVPKKENIQPVVASKTEAK